MITLIAESKTMATECHTVSHEAYMAHKPIFEKEASEIMRSLSSATATDIAMRIGISPSLATKAYAMAYDFPFKSHGLPALAAFSGDVFRALDVSTLSDEVKEYANHTLYIVSSLYGLLRPADIIKPYRLEFNKNCMPDLTTPSTFWRHRLTTYFLSQLKDYRGNEVLDLMPLDAAKLFDRERIKQYCNVAKAEFKTVTDNGILKSPHSKKIKELRGKMLRHILLNKIESFDQLTHMHSRYFVYDETSSKPDSLVFVTLE